MKSMINTNQPYFITLMTCLTCLSGFIPALLRPLNNDSFCTSNVLQLLLSDGVTYSVTFSSAVNTADNSTGSL
jgi:hypothetical protein